MICLILLISLIINCAFTISGTKVFILYDKYPHNYVLMGTRESLCLVFEHLPTSQRNREPQPAPYEITVLPPGTPMQSLLLTAPASSFPYLEDSSNLATHLNFGDAVLP